MSDLRQRLADFDTRAALAAASMRDVTTGKVVKRMHKGFKFVVECPSGDNGCVDINSARALAADAAARLKANGGAVTSTFEEVGLPAAEEEGAGEIKGKGKGKGKEKSE